MERQLSKNCSKFCGLTGPTSDSMPGKCPAKTPGCTVDQNESMASSCPRRSTKPVCDCDNVRVIRSSHLDMFQGLLCKRVLGPEHYKDALCHRYPLFKLLVFGVLSVHYDSNCDAH